jgi:hypothetical protein
MAKCEWCGRTVKSLNMITDNFTNTTCNICDSCNKSYEEHECIKCGATSSILIKGMCTNCYQTVMHSKQVRKEEAINGLSPDAARSVMSDVEMTDKDFDDWMTMGKAFSTKDLKESVELRRIWIMVKLMTAGIKDQDVINENVADIETLLDRCFSKIINNKCKLIIAYDKETRSLVKRSEVIDYLNQVYIIKA